MKIILFFTRSVSLGDWCNSGLLEREKLVYERFLINGIASKVYWFTYGSNDLKISNNLKKNGILHKNISIQQMPFVFNLPLIGSWIYSIFIPFFHYRVFSRADIIKTNQLDGGWSAVIAKLIYKKPLVVRCGYIPSKLLSEVGGISRLRMFLTSMYEKYVLLYSDICIVASVQDMNYIDKKYLIPNAKVKIINNYVDTDKFFPFDNKKTKIENRLIFVGRLSYQKNIPSLLYALKELNLGLDVVGDGELIKEIKALAKSLFIDVKMLGRVSNAKLPYLLNQYSYFILPSFSEGMPKVLLEAMSCGLVCIGTPVSGIIEIIQNGKNGILSSGTDVNSIKLAINIAIRNNNEKIKTLARKTIVSSFSLNKYVEKESEVFMTIVDNRL